MAESVGLIANDYAGEKQGKGRRLWKKVKYQLVEYHSLPGYLKDNEYILDYYRSEWPLKQIFLSIFSIHNETLNVWTYRHLIGFFLFLALTIYTATKVQKVVDLQSLQHLLQVLKKADLHKIQSELVPCFPSLSNLANLQRLRDDLKTSLPSMDKLSLSNWHLLELLSSCLPHRYHANQTNKSITDNVANIIAPLLRPIPRWPFYAFLGGAMFCLLASSPCHLLSFHFRRVAYIMLRLDYGGIAALITTSFYPPVYYSFMCNPSSATSILYQLLFLASPQYALPCCQCFRILSIGRLGPGCFFGMGVSGVVPVLHKLILFRGQPEAVHITSYEILMGVLYGLGALVYATRIPEKWMPGKFDLAGA